MNQIQQSGRPAADGTQLFPTQNYLSEEARTAVVSLLNTTLADTTTLMTQAKFAHWNVKGMQFYGLHELFDDLAETLEGHVDLIAERITALGGQAMGTAAMATAKSGIPRMPTTAVSGPEFVRIVADHLAMHDAALYQAIHTAQDRDDLDTADLLNEVSRDVSQFLWFLEAHLQTQSGGAGQPTGSATGSQTQAPGGPASTATQSPQRF